MSALPATSLIFIVLIVGVGHKIGAGQQSQEPTRGLAEALFSEGPESASDLHWALSRRRYDEALDEMKLVSDIDAIDPVLRSTALCIAASDETADAFDMVQALILRHGADPNASDTQGAVPLHYASASGNLSVVQLLVTHGADVNSEVGDGTNITPLYMAYKHRRNRVADYLKLYGADELEDSIRMDLEVQASVIEVIRDFPIDRLVQQLEEGETPNALIKGLIFRSSKAAVDMLESQGRHDLIEDYRNWVNLVPEILDGLPQVGEEIDPERFVAEFLQSTLKELTSRSATKVRHQEETRQ